MGQEDRHEMAKGKIHTIIEQEKQRKSEIRNDRQKKTRPKRRFPEPQSHADRSPGRRGDRQTAPAPDRLWGQEGSEKGRAGGREAERLEGLPRESDCEGGEEAG